MHRHDLERMTREQLIEQAERLSIPRPRVLTQPELIDEIIGRTAKDDRERAKARGWLGRARDLLASVVERGLHMPEAARVLRKQGDERGFRPPPPPLPTVTLAEIYAAQGHFERAITVLDEVIAREPDHREAHAMRQRFTEQAQRARARGGREKEQLEADDVGEGSEQPVREAPPPGTTDVEVRAEPHASAATASPVAQPPAPSAEKSPPPPPRVSREVPAEPPTPASTELAAPDATPAASTGPQAAAEPPLPDRYEVDEIVAISVDPRTVYLYWEVRPTTLARARARRPDGALAVRVVSVVASWEGPVVDTRDLRVDALYGDRFLRDVQPGSNVRVSIGWLDGAFEPFAVGSEVTTPRAVPVESVAQEVARWEADPVVAPFQGRRAEAVPPNRHWPAPPPGASSRRASVLAERARMVPGAPLGPVDTGVETWDALPGEGASQYGGELVPSYGEGSIEEEAPGWLEPGGSSELGRGGPGRRVRPLRRRAPIVTGPGGASELSGGGASELFV